MKTPAGASGAAETASALTRALEGRLDVRVAVLFGSRARGAFAEGSDVDVGVEAPGVDLLSLAAWLSERLDAEVDVVDLESAGVPLLEEVIRDGLVVHEARPGGGASWRTRALITLETDRPWFARMRDAWLRKLAERGV